MSIGSCQSARVDFLFDVYALTSGKSAFLVCFIQGIFYDPTIESGYIKHFEVDGELCRLCQETFTSLF